MTLEPKAAAQDPRRTGDSRWYTILGIAALLLLWMLRDLLTLVALSVLLAYALDPLVGLIERIPLPRRRRLPRAWAAALLMLVVAGGVGWALVLLLPRLGSELARFAETVPGALARMLETLRAWAASRGLSDTVEPIARTFETGGTDVSRTLATQGVALIGSVFSRLDQIVGLLVLPLLSFYLLAEAEEVRQSALGFVPASARGRMIPIGAAVDRALRSYVRGQGLVCLVMGVAVGAVLAILQFPYVLFLGVLIAVAEVVPYLGFLIACVAIALTGFTVDPFHAVAGLIAYAVLNNLIGLFVTPRLMGRYLRLHPYIVTISIFAGAKLLGPVGIMVALPAAAVLQSLFGELVHRPVTAPGERAPGSEPRVRGVQP